MKLGLPGFEPGLVDSESTVLAITPQAQWITIKNNIVCVDRESNPDLVLGRHEF